MARLRYIENARTGSNGTVVTNDNKLFFDDSNAYIYASASGTLDLVATTIAITGDLTVSGSFSYGAISIPANQALLGTLTVGVDDTGYDVTFFGATSGSYWSWDESENAVVIVGSFTETGNMAVTGTFTLTGAPTITGNATIIGTLTVGVDDTGHDVKFYGATSGSYWLWDEDADGVVLVGDFTQTGAMDITGNTQLTGTLTVGVDDTGHDVKFYGATSGSYFEWDESENQVNIVAAVALTGAIVQTGAYTVTGNAQVTGTLTVGVDDTGHDVKFYGATSGSYVLWDESDDQLEFVNSSITLTEGALAADGRAMKFSLTSATPAMSDGYGAVEIDATISGTATGWFSPLSSWINITSSGVAGTGGYMCAQQNGVYSDSGGNTGSSIIFGMRASAILTDAPTKLCPFSINTSNRAITAIFDIASGPALGVSMGAHSSAVVGSVPLFIDNNGNIRYVRVYGDAT